MVVLSNWLARWSVKPVSSELEGSSPSTTTKKVKSWQEVKFLKISLIP
jgi:hypothetical protein